MIMKKIIPFILLIILSITSSYAQTTKVQKDPAGQWKYEAPYAPEGYTAGKIIVDLIEKKYTVAIMLAGSDYKINGENVKFVNDSLLLSVYIEGEAIAVKLKMEVS
jgi:hypothetical protein